ncbi:MAG: hypothetical protein V3S98_07330, partial [Dehalococcoidia bacterium]
ASRRFQLNAVVAQYAELLAGGFWARGTSLEEVRVSAERVRGLLPDDPSVVELVELVSRTERVESGAVM